MRGDSERSPGERLERVRQQYPREIEIFRAHFSRGLTELCDPRFLQRRYDEFKLKHDPIYPELLKAMDDEALAKTFISYWTIAHTLATRSRFWIEDAIADYLIQWAQHEGRNTTRIYSQAMLGHGWMDRGLTVADFGEDYREHLSERRAWRVRVQRSSLRAIDLLVGEQERERVREASQSVQQSLWPRRAWDRWQDPELVKKDEGHLVRIANSLKGPPESEVTLQCNLVVIEPNRLDGRPHAWAIRFVNPKTMGSHPVRKQERVNLLRLYAWLMQEKVLRDPDQIEVCVAELLPRYSDFDELDRYPDYFSSLTYWSSDYLWKSLGIPFEVVTLALRDVAGQFREELIRGLRDLLPKSG